MHILLCCFYLRLCCFHCILYLLVSFICHSLSLLLWMSAHYEILMTLTSHWLCFRIKVTCHSLWLPQETCTFFQFTFLLLFMNFTIYLNVAIESRQFLSVRVCRCMHVWTALSSTYLRFGKCFPSSARFSRSGHHHLELLIQIWTSIPILTPHVCHTWVIDCLLTIDRASLLLFIIMWCLGFLIISFLSDMNVWQNNPYAS